MKVAKKKKVHILSQSKSQLKMLEPKTTDDWPGERVQVSVCIVLYLYLFKVGKSTDTVYSKKKRKEKEKKKNPAHYVISTQISGERTAVAYVISVFTL